MLHHKIFCFFNSLFSFFKLNILSSFLIICFTKLDTSFWAIATITSFVCSEPDSFFLGNSVDLAHPTCFSHLSGYPVGVLTFSEVLM